MIELLTESLFRIEHDAKGKHVIIIHQSCHDGMARVAERVQTISLTEYGLDALEKNLKSLLLLIQRHKYPDNKEVLINGRSYLPELRQNTDVG